MNILNITLTDCMLEMLPSTTYLSQQDKITLALHGDGRINEEIYLYFRQDRQCTITQH
jgi:hypothetical protein